jgi:hypothetical protein
MHLALTQSISFTATAAAAWLMVRSGVAKGALKVKTTKLCPACGRKRVRNGCRCTRDI